MSRWSAWAFGRDDIGYGLDRSIPGNPLVLAVGPHRRLDLAIGRIEANRCSGSQPARAGSTSVSATAQQPGAAPCSEWVEDVLAWERTTDRADRYGFVDSALGLYRQWAAGIGDDPVGAADAMRGMIIELDRNGASVVRTLQWGLVAELQLLAGRSTDALVAVKAALARAVTGAPGASLDRPKSGGRH